MAKRVLPELTQDVSIKLKTIGQKVKERRKSIEKNYQSFADNKGLNSMTLWRIENGENFNMASFIELLDALGMTLEEFFKGMK